MSDHTPEALDGPDPGQVPQGAAGEPDAAAFARVDQAARAARARRDPRWVEVSDRVLAKALQATRRSFPVRAMTPSGPVSVSEQVLVTYIRDAVQGQVPDAALLHVRIDLAGRDTLAGVTVSLIGRYGVELLPVADRVRDLTAARLRDLLGPVEVPVRVETMHVHFADVVDGDPHDDDPWA